MNETKHDSPINMSNLVSANVAHYLHPDYLQPLATTLDAKKSPLALLAQTCSSIGKDSSPAKSIIPPIEKDKKETNKSTEKISIEENAHRKSTSNECVIESSKDSTKKLGFKSAPPKDIPPLVSISGSSSRKCSPTLSNSSEKSGEPVTVTASVSRTTASTAQTTHNSSSSKSSGSVSSEREKDCEREREREKNRDNGSDGRSTSRSGPEHISSKVIGHIHHGLNSVVSGFTLPGLSLYGHGYSLDPAAASLAYASSLAAATAHSGYSLSTLAAQNAALSKTGLTPGLPSYVSYAHVRTPSGATTLVPVCRDPYCTNCQLTMQNSHVSSTCTASGCSQCAHEKSLQSLNALGMAGPSSLSVLPQFSLTNSLSSMPSGLSSYGLTPSLYAHSLLGAPVAHCQSMPYVCNWVAGTDYCGKRYTTSEELLKHLRTHSSSSDAASLMSNYTSLGIPPALGLPGYSNGLLPTHYTISPNSLRRPYPTIHSPLSSVVNGSRYHPYKTQLLGDQSVLTPGQTLQSLGTYYSPYSLYSQRIGAAAVP